MTTRKSRARVRARLAVGILLGAALLAGCRDDVLKMFSGCDDCGTIESITPRRVQREVSGGGAVAGAIIGGVIGHQFGSGRGNQAATAGGAVGGALAGNEVEKRRRQQVVYDITVRMHTGDLFHVTVPARDNLEPGDAVQVIDGQVRARPSKSA
jgi:outer membrane lipoprotein SlyB